MKKVLLFLISLSFLSACAPADYNVQVNLTEEAKTALLETIDNNWALYEEHLAAGEGTALDVVNVVRAHEELGQFNEAIAIYEDYLKKGFDAQAIRNNLGRLYDKFELYKKAEKQYQALVDTYNQEKYLNDLAWLHIKQENLSRAQEYYDAWKVATGKKDARTEKGLETLAQK